MKRRKKTARHHAGAKGSVKKGKSNHIKKNQQKYKPEELAVLSALKRKPNEPMGSRQLMRAAGVSNKARFYEALHNLERVGDIKVDKNHKVSYISPEKDMPATIVSLSPGFGFAKPNEGEDVFIHGSGLRGAFLGDEVLLTDVKKQDKGLYGWVRRVTKRSQMPITGTVHLDKTGGYLVPDGALRYNLKINLRDLHGAKDGEKVTVKPKQDQRGDWTFAAVKTIFGSGESARVCADAIIERYGIPTDFSQMVLEQADILAKAKITDVEMSGRIDLRGKSIFTIDGADAKDLDDAISVEKIRSGYKLGVHIADVSHYVKAGTALDEEAFERGTSVYFADRVIPMLPKALSNGICSLNAGTDKLTFSAFVYFDMEGKITRYHFQKSVINSKVRGIYSEVNQIFDGSASKAIIDKYKPVRRGLEHARALATILTERAQKRGEMDLGSDELYFVLDDHGVCVDIRPRTTGEAEGLIEQMMISANRAASMFAQKNRLPFLYRVHAKPKTESIAGLCELLDSMNIACKELKKNTVATGDFAAVLNRVRGTPREVLISQRVLRTMEKAQYSENETGHFGLALKDYSHFTSPIRRYPDLAIHRILTDYLAGLSHEEIWKQYEAFTQEAAVQSSKAEVRAVNAERAAEDCYAAEYMKQHIGEKYAGIISGMMSKGLFVRISNGVEGFVGLTDFNQKDYEFDGMITMRDRGSGEKLMVGDPLEILVASSEVSSGRVNFLPT